VFEPRGYGAMATIVKTFFAVFFIKKILIYQYYTELCAEIGSLHFRKRRSSGKSANRKILCLHKLSTLCSIDFELRSLFVGALLARVEMQLKRPNFQNHAREFRFTGNLAPNFLYTFIEEFQE
jgi:hypothetical protein